MIMLVDKIYVYYYHGEEEWKDIKMESIKPIYKVSNYGNVMNVNTGKLLTPHPDKDGYDKFVLYDVTGKRINCKGHRLVAMHFCEGWREEMNTVNHKNGVKDFNMPENLEWVNNTMNRRHAFDTGLQKTHGTYHGQNVYPEEHIRVICKYFEEGYMNSEIIKIMRDKFGYEKGKLKSLIKHLRARRNWKHVTKDYNY